MIYEKKLAGLSIASVLNTRKEIRLTIDAYLALALANPLTSRLLSFACVVINQSFQL